MLDFTLPQMGFFLQNYRQITQRRHVSAIIASWNWTNFNDGNSNAAICMPLHQNTYEYINLHWIYCFRIHVNI